MNDAYNKPNTYNINDYSKVRTIQGYFNFDASLALVFWSILRVHLKYFLFGATKRNRQNQKCLKKNGVLCTLWCMGWLDDDGGGEYWMERNPV